MTDKTITPDGTWTGELVTVLGVPNSFTPGAESAGFPVTVLRAGLKLVTVPGATISWSEPAALGNTAHYSNRIPASTSLNPGGDTSPAVTVDLTVTFLGAAANPDTSTTVSSTITFDPGETSKVVVIERPQPGRRATANIALSNARWADGTGGGGQGLQIGILGVCGLDVSADDVPEDMTLDVDGLGVVTLGLADRAQQTA